MPQETGAQERFFKMKTVTGLTGFSPTLLRAWERRYDFLKPERLPGGHRLYTETDLKVLQKVSLLLDAGHSIGEAAAMGRNELLGDALKTGSDLGQAAKELAPIDLQVFRSSRFRGEGLGVSLRDLDVSDLTTVSHLYEAVKTVYELWLYMDDEARDEGLVRSRLDALQHPDFVARVARLGSSSSSYPTLVRAAIEDTRWGALGPLLRHLKQGNSSTDMLRTSVLLARDQAKIMRNSFHDIDTVLRSADESHKAHGIRGMVEKVSAMSRKFEAVLDWEGSVSSRCLETSAVDRVLYDFLRRIDALDPESVTLWVGPINSTLTRWAFRFHKAGFSAHASEDLATTAVSMSVGLSPVAALERRYLGHDENWAWFHWPIFDLQDSAALCECEV